MPKITEKMWRARLAELGAGKLTTRQAAKMLGCSIRQVQRRCEAAGIKPVDPELPAPKKEEPVSPPPASQQPSPEVAPGKPEGNADYQKALDAVGGQKPSFAGPVAPTQADIAAAGEKIATFCVDTLNTVKGLAVTAVAEYQYTTSADDPRIVAVKKLGPPAETAVRSNADKLYPYLYRLMQGWGPLGAWLAMDLLMSFRTVKGVAVEKGYKPKERPQRPAAPRKEEPAPAEAESQQPGGPPPPDVKPVAVLVPGI